MHNDYALVIILFINAGDNQPKILWPGKSTVCILTRVWHNYEYIMLPLKYIWNPLWDKRMYKVIKWSNEMAFTKQSTSIKNLFVLFDIIVMKTEI